MITEMNLIQALIGFSILNVWFFRFSQPSRWRGGQARNMREEFQQYHLPSWSVNIVGFTKVSLAIMLIAGIWIPSLTKPAAFGIALMMAGAVMMHLRIKDPLSRAFPAFSFMALSVVLVLF